MNLPWLAIELGAAIATPPLMFRLPTLPYKMSELAPFLTEEQMSLHYEKHHGTYIDNVNKVLMDSPGLREKYLEDLILDSSGTLFNNAAQVWNHTFFWFNLAPQNQGGSPSAQFAEACQSSFGTLDDLFTGFVDAGVKCFGSGWVWLCADHSNRLHIITTPNAEVPWKAATQLRPLLVADLWEHAYYIDYHNQRKAYLEAMRTYLNWNFINENLKSRYMKSLHRALISDEPLPMPAAV